MNEAGKPVDITVDLAVRRSDRDGHRLDLTTPSYVAISSKDMRVGASRSRRLRQLRTPAARSYSCAFKWPSVQRG
jgi:hypothetical protein